MRTLIAVVAAVLGTVMSFARPLGEPPHAPTMNAAETFMQAGNLKDAAAEFERLVAVEPQNGVAWVRFGRALIELGEYARAIDAETKAAGIKGVEARAYFNLGCAFAGLKDQAKAIAAIKQAIAAGWTNDQLLTQEPRLATLISSPEYTKALDDLRAANDKPEFHWLDFWVGDWNVYDAQANIAGTNLLLAHDKGCVITEDWSGTGGGTGRSMNFYDPKVKAWKQVWVSSTGDVLTMNGRFVNGAMRFDGSLVTRGGAERPMRMVVTPLPKGRVRQAFFQSQDQGTTWILGFDAVYVPKGQPFSASEFPTDAVSSDV